MQSQREVVGRRGELDELTAFLGRMEEGPSACVLAGPPGMGKTTLWRWCVEAAEAAGHPVLRARPTGAEARLAFSGLADLLTVVGDGGFDALPAIQRRALDIALMRSEEPGAVADARAVATGVLSLLRELAARSPVLVAVDDVHWLDTPTAAGLAFALRRLEREPVGLLVSLRSGEQAAGAIPDAVPAERRAELALGPLSLAAIQSILRLELGRSFPRPLLVRITTASGGNPLYALEIARELDRLGEPAAAGPLPIPDGMQRLVRGRLARLPPRTRTALLEAAALSVPRTTVVAERALAAAEEAGVVRIAGDGRIHFEHPLFAAAVYESAASARRRSVHRELAARLADPEESARHLALAAGGPDTEAVRRLDEASVLARARGAPEAAAELAELALRLAPDSPAVERADRLLATAELHFEAGDLARAQALLEQTVGEPACEPIRPQALRLLAQLYGRRSSFAEARVAALAALEAADRDRELEAQLELDLAYYLVSLGDLDGAAPHAHAAVAGAEAAGNEGLLANGLAVRAVVEFLGGRGFSEHDMARALACEERVRTVPLAFEPRFIQGLLLLWQGRSEEALGPLDVTRVAAVEQGRESEAPLGFIYLVWACLWSGDLARASKLGEEGRQKAALLDDRASNALALSAAALADAYAGRAAAAREEATEAIALFEQLQWLSGTIWPRWALGFLELSLGDPAAAHAALEPLAAIPLDQADPVLSMFLPDEIEALVELGRADRARELLEPFEARAQACRRDWALAFAARSRALIEAAGDDLDAALVAAEEALRRHDSMPMPFELARTLYELGRLHRRRKQKRLARLALEEALAVFDSLGAPLWSAKARTELARVSTRKVPDGLTATEEQIALLAAGGLTNQAIAERAFVTVNTVEANLTRAYRKLGISSRAQLGRALEGASARVTP